MTKENAALAKAAAWGTIYVALKLGVLIWALSIAACGRMYEQEGLIRWPDGNCAWPCIGGGGGGGTAYGTTYTVGAYTFTDVTW